MLEDWGTRDASAVNGKTTVAVSNTFLDTALNRMAADSSG